MPSVEILQMCRVQDHSEMKQYEFDHVNEVHFNLP